MSCKNKKCNTSDCKGCNDQSLAIPAFFSNDPAVCPKPEICSESFNMECICYNGADILELDIRKGDKLDVVLKKLITATLYPACADFDDSLTCNAVVDIVILDRSSTTFSLSWDSVEAAINYTIEYRAPGGSWISTTPVVAPTLTAMVTGLLPETVYDVRILTTCGSSTCYSLTIRLKTNTI
jgi:hypothetical protein